MPFDPNDKIILREGTTGIARVFYFPICSSATANDGTLPNGTVISSVDIEVYKKTTTGYDTENVSTDIIEGTPSNDDDTVTLTLGYPNTNGAGFYKIVFKLTLDSGGVYPDEFLTLEAK